MASGGRASGLARGPQHHYLSHFQMDVEDDTKSGKDPDMEKKAEDEKKQEKTLPSLTWKMIQNLERIQLRVNFFV